jgi:predicted ATPase/DNA-binding SARP family transcriptional activator
LFGGLKAVRGDIVVTRFRTRKTASLLGWLALHLGRPHPREELIDVFWPEASLSSGRNSLSRALSALRQALEPPGVPARSVILATRADVRLSADSVDTDVASFARSLAEAVNVEASSAIAALEAATAEHRGPLLPGVYLDGVLEERRRLAAANLDALLRLTELHTEAGALPRALDRALAAQAADPLSEEAARAAMRVYEELGEPAAGLRCYEALQEALERELDVTPTDASRRLAVALQTSTREVEEPAPPTPASAKPGSLLPVPASRFFGREEELRELSTWAVHGVDRLRTISGPSGTGKTRLALEAARAFAELNPTRLWFVPLADVAEDTAIRARFATSAGLRGDANLSEVAAALGEGALVIVDNAEHVVEGVAATVGELLKAQPDLRCLVTSQRRLGLGGERERPLSPLGLPMHGSLQAGASSNLSHQLDAAARSPAVALFVDRVASLRPGFSLNPTNVLDIVRICTRLDGIPLAIELAAGRAQVLSPGELRERLEAGVAKLRQDDPSAPARHRTLEAAFSWSFDLLDAPLQRVLTQLSVFRGGWTLAAAERVCEDPMMLDHLADLAEVSLIERVEVEGAGFDDPGDADDLGPVSRFRMLECIRQFAHSRLPGGEHEALGDRHAACFADLAGRAAAVHESAQDRRIDDRLQADHENCGAALQWLAREGGSKKRRIARAEQGLEMVAALCAFWTTRGHTVEGVAWLDALLAIPTPRNARRAHALRMAGNLLWTQGRPSRARFEESLAVFRELRDAKGTAHALNGLGISRWAAGHLDEAEAAFEEGLRIWSGLADERAIADAKNNLGLIAMGRADYELALRWFRESHVIYERENIHRSGARALNNLGTVTQELLDFPAALDFFKRALVHFEKLGDHRSSAYALHNAAAVYRLLDQPRRAQEWASRALELFLDLSDRRGIANCNRVLADVARDRGAVDEARQRYLRALEVGREAGDQEVPLDCIEGLALLLVNNSPLAAARLSFGVVRVRAEHAIAPLPSGEDERAALRADLAAKLTKAALEGVEAGAVSTWPELRALIDELA